jgi:hypothetical protein
MRTRTKALALSLLAAILLTGCSGMSGQSDSSGDTSGSTSTASGWNCESEQDGLGETQVCQSSTTDDAGTYWVLTIMCTSDQQTLHSVYGLDSGLNDLVWDADENDVAKVRIGSDGIEDWKFQTKADGKALVFSYLAGKRSNENASTWEFLKRIASAKTFGFKAFDAEGYSQSAQFNVEDSVPMAASFAALGCAG